MKTRVSSFLSRRIGIQSVDQRFLESKLTITLDNHGERLVPGYSHNLEETVRHKSSYRFFKAIIEADCAITTRQPIRILDLGCGVGHGSLMLSDINGSEIVAIDASADAIEHAKEHYGAANITYLAKRAEEYLLQAPKFDYVVSRHALEHIPDGLHFALKIKYQRRIIINVPYLEPAMTSENDHVNPHHELNDISEQNFDCYSNKEFFYEDLAGVTTRQPESANSIVCVASELGMPSICDLLSFPFEPWRPNELEALGLKFSETIRDKENKASQELSALSSTLQALQEQHKVLSAEYEALGNRKSVRLAIKFAALFQKINFKN